MASTIPVFPVTRMPTEVLANFVIMSGSYRVQNVGTVPIWFAKRSAEPVIATLLEERGVAIVPYDVYTFETDGSDYVYLWTQGDVDSEAVITDSPGTSVITDGGDTPVPTISIQDVLDAIKTGADLFADRSVSSMLTIKESDLGVVKNIFGDSKTLNENAAISLRNAYGVAHPLWAPTYNLDRSKYIILRWNGGEQVQRRNVVGDGWEDVEHARAEDFNILPFGTRFNKELQWDEKDCKWVPVSRLTTNIVGITTGIGIDQLRPAIVAHLDANQAFGATSLENNYYVQNFTIGPFGGILSYNNMRTVWADGANAPYFWIASPSSLDTAGGWGLTYPDFRTDVEFDTSIRRYLRINDATYDLFYWRFTGNRPIPNASAGIGFSWSDPVPAANTVNLIL